MIIPDITSSKIGDMITKCITDLEHDDANSLMELAGIFNAIAACNDDSSLFIFPYCIGGFAGSLTRAKSLTAIPILAEDLRKKHSVVITNAISKSKDALKIIKEQCMNEGDPKKLLDAIGTFFQQTQILNKQIEQYNRANRNQSPQ